jgi:hypothetical protein
MQICASRTIAQTGPSEPYAVAAHWEHALGLTAIRQQRLKCLRRSVRQGYISGVAVLGQGQMCDPFG